MAENANCVHNSKKHSYSLTNCYYIYIQATKPCNKLVKSLCPIIKLAK